MWSHDIVDYATIRWVNTVWPLLAMLTQSHVVILVRHTYKPHAHASNNVTCKRLVHQGFNMVRRPTSFTLASTNRWRSPGRPWWERVEGQYLILGHVKKQQKKGKYTCFILTNTTTVTVWHWCLGNDGKATCHCQVVSSYHYQLVKSRNHSHTTYPWPQRLQLAQFCSPSTHMQTLIMHRTHP